MDHATLATIWFGLLGVLLTGYAILDGFDFGVGILHPLVARTDEERRLVLNSIGPLWDGNEVWLVTFGGALFAAFPAAYATVFSGFYTAFMLLLVALIGRAVSIEFRSKVQSKAWRAVWDVAFFAASLLAPFLLGVAGGNLIAGVPLAHGTFKMPLWQQVWSTTTGPYPLLVGLMTVALFTMHGATYLVMKTEGALRERVQRWVWRASGVFGVLYVVTTVATLRLVPTATANLDAQPLFWLLPLANVLAVFNVPRATFKNQPLFAFLSSAATIAALGGLFALAIFPSFVHSTLGAVHDLTIHNTASSAKTLGLMLWVAGIGMPFVLSYTVAVYWTFRGPTTLDRSSY